MTHARQAQQALGVPASHLIIALAAVAVVAVIITIAVLNPFVQPAGVSDTGAPQVLLDHGRDWEMQRRQQAGLLDPVVDAGRDWEQRRDQGGS